MAWTPPNQDPNQNQGPNQNPNVGSNPSNDPYSAPQGPYQQPNYTESPYGNPQNPYGAPQSPYGAPPNVPQNPYGAPQYPGYGAPEDPYAAYRVPGQAPQDTGSAIRELPRQWLRAITRPSPMTFAEEMGKATWPMIWIQLVIYGVVVALFGLLARLITSSSTAVPSGLNGSSAATYQRIISTSQNPAYSILSVILYPLFFLLLMAIFLGMAKAFRGEGNFKTQAYTTLLFTVPLSIVTGLLSLIPILGGFVALGVFVYELVLQIFVMRPVHRLSGGRATAVVLIPWAILFILFCALFIVLGFLIAAALQTS